MPHRRPLDHETEACNSVLAGATTRLPGRLKQDLDSKVGRVDLVLFILVGLGGQGGGVRLRWYTAVG